MAKMITGGASGNLFVCVSSQQSFGDKQLQVPGGGKQNFPPEHSEKQSTNNVCNGQFNLAFESDLRLGMRQFVV